MIKAFRDTWDLGIHSYLTYLRDRLLLAKELLYESGSVFVQISDENLHHVRELLDEVFWAGNFVAVISYVTTSGFPSKSLSRAGDYVIWFVRNADKLKYNQLYPIGSTRAMRIWYTTKPCQPTQKSQISHLVADSAWETHCANVLEQAREVLAYVKNDHLGFQLHYLWNGARRRFVPDFLIRLASGKMLILEIKGEDSPQNRAKQQALDAWIKGVNAKGGFGSWAWDVAFEMSGIQDIVKQHAS